MQNIFGRTEENWYLDELKQDQRVEFRLDESINGFGKVCGISSSGVTLGGRTYIIEPDEMISDFSHIAIMEIFLNPIK